MVKALEPGKPAKLNYNDVRYAHVYAKAGEQQILTSDPWSYIQRTLTEARGKRRGIARQNLERAIYFADLAEDFYRAAESSQLPAQGTLAYYSMLNLVKAYISANGVELEAKPEHHGLSLEQATSGRLKVHAHMKNAVNVFSEFCGLLGKPLPGDFTLSFEDIALHIPELHSLYVSLGHASKRKLLPVEIMFLVNQTQTHLFTEVHYEKKNESKVDTKNFLKGARKEYFRDALKREGWVTYRSKRRRPVGKENLNRAYKACLEEYSHFELVSLLTRQGYRYYCDLKPGGLHHLSYSLAGMFYLGAAARYRPLEIRRVLEGPLRPLVSEMVAISPRQFLYQLASLISGKVCLIPFSSI